MVGFFNFDDASKSKKWGFSSVGRASALHAEGQGFDSPNLHSLLPARADDVCLSRKNVNNV